MTLAFRPLTLLLIEQLIKPKAAHSFIHSQTVENAGRNPSLFRVHQSRCYQQNKGETHIASVQKNRCTL